MLLAKNPPSTDSISPGFSYISDSEFSFSSEGKKTLPSTKKNFLFSDLTDLPLDLSYPQFNATTKETFIQMDVSGSESSLFTSFITFFVERIKNYVTDSDAPLQSEELRKLVDTINSVYDQLNVEEVLQDIKFDLISELEEIAVECKAPDWDGYDALPIEPRTLELAKRFVYALPEELPLPEAAPEPDGSISLDWIWSNDRVFSLSIGKTDELSYAWIDNGDRGYAVAKFDGKSVPKRVIETIRVFLL